MTFSKFNNNATNKSKFVPYCIFSNDISETILDNKLLCIILIQEIKK